MPAHVHLLFLPAFSPDPRYGYLTTLPLGMSYSWSSSGALVPSGSLTVWQPGNISLGTQGSISNQPVVVTPSAYSWGTTFLAWSPDGRYLIDSVSLATNTNKGDQPTDDIAWSPSGRVLAAFPEPNLSSPISGSTTSESVTFHDCATGKTLGMLQPQGKSQVSASSLEGPSLVVPTSLPRWSRDGSHFLLFSQLLSTITI